MTWKDWIQPGVVVAAVVGIGSWQWLAVDAVRADMQTFRAEVRADVGMLAAKVDGLAETVHAIDKRLAVVETRLGAVEGRLERMEARLGTVESRLGVVESRMDAGGYARALDRGDIMMELLNAPPHELRALASALETAEQREDTP